MSKKNHFSSHKKPKSHRRRVAVNPTLPPARNLSVNGSIRVIEYDKNSFRQTTVKDKQQLKAFLESGKNIWIHVENIEKSSVEEICKIFNIHPLIAEDILSIGQRPKIDEFEDFIFTLVNILYLPDDDLFIESAQLNIILQKQLLITFQTDGKEFFEAIKDRLDMPESRLRHGGVDYLYYSLLDMIVDNYFAIMEKLGDKIEDTEELISRDISTTMLTSINDLRKEMMFLRRSISPVREIINSVLRNETGIITPYTERYFKDIYDHIIQVNELAENYRDMMINLQDLYLSNVNIRMNEVMKVMAIVTCLLAPATVIGGIFGMNFQRIPISDSPAGFYIAVFLMLFIPLLMIWIFKKRGWF